MPANPVKAAADGAKLPLIIFTLAFGVALTKVAADRREAVVGFFRGLADAMTVLVGWVIAFAPIGVFALAAPLAARMGFSAAGALLSYIMLATTLTIVVLGVVVYPATVVFGGVPLARLLRVCAPAQAVALSSRSTMASLPAMIDAARRLGVAERVTVFVVPLAASMLRVGSAVGQTVAVLFAARLFNVNIAPLHLAAILIVASSRPSPCPVFRVAASLSWSRFFSRPMYGRGGGRAAWGRCDSGHVPDNGQRDGRHRRGNCGPIAAAICLKGLDVKPSKPDIGQVELPEKKQRLGIRRLQGEGQSAAIASAR